MSGISPDSGGSSDTAMCDGDAVQAQRKGLSKLACRVPGCTLELRTGFLTRCRCCEFHSRQVSLEFNGTLQRFCQQCGFFHPLEEFDDLRRSCRRSLERHRVCRRIRRQRAAEKHAAATAATAPPQGGGKEAAGAQQQQASDDGALPTPHLDAEPAPAAAAGARKKRRQRASGKKRAAPAAAAAPRPAAVSKRQRVKVEPELVKVEPLVHVAPIPEAAATITGNSGITVEQQQQSPPQQQELPQPGEPCQQQHSCESQAVVFTHTSVRLTPARLAPTPASVVNGNAAPPLPVPINHVPMIIHSTESPSQASVEGPRRPLQPGSARAVIAATQQLMAAPPVASPTTAAPLCEWNGYLESIQPFAQHQLAVPPPPVLVEEAMRILRAPTPSFLDMPSVSEMLDITADLGMLEEMQQHGPRHGLAPKPSSISIDPLTPYPSFTPFAPAWPCPRLAQHVDFATAGRMY